MYVVCWLFVCIEAVDVVLIACSVYYSHVIHNVMRECVVTGVASFEYYVLMNITWTKHGFTTNCEH